MPFTRREFLKQGLTAAATLSLGVLGDSDAAAKQKLAALSKSATRKLRKRLKGELILPDSLKYDAARRIWNPGIDRHPAMIARCAETSDVVAVVSFAREHDLPVAVRGGGHDPLGHSVCDRGMVVDCSLMNGISVDSKGQVARVGAGAKVYEFDEAAQGLGLATSLGECPSVGVSGLTLGGGMGWLMCKYGLACDNLLAARVVTADGNVLMASPQENADLFWAIRGGGGNFGAVTELQYRLYPVKEVFGGLVSYPISQAGPGLRVFDQFMSSAPDELTAFARIIVATAPLFVIGACYCGPPDRGERLLQPLRSIGRPLEDSMKVRSYLEIQSLMAPPQQWASVYWNGGFIRTIDDPTTDAIVAHVSRSPSRLGMITLDHIHGAVSRISTEATAFAPRLPGYSWWAEADWEGPAQADSSVAWADEFRDLLEPFSPHAGAYVNVLGNESDSQVRAAYGPNYPRLVALKNKFDPTNFFRLNQNIKPTA